MSQPRLDTIKEPCTTQRPRFIPHRVKRGRFRRVRRLEFPRKFGVSLARHAAMTHDRRMPTTNADLIGTAEAARIIGKSPRTIHRLVSSGLLTPAIVAPGGHSGSYLFERADIERVKAVAA